MVSFIEIHLQVTELWEKSYYFRIAPRIDIIYGLDYRIRLPVKGGTVLWSLAMLGKTATSSMA